MEPQSEKPSLKLTIKFPKRESTIQESKDAHTDDELHPNECNQLALYDPAPSQTQRHLNKVLPSVGAFTVQCANCFKWRLIPTLDKYQQIREHNLERPFSCEAARDWRPDITCDHPEDISQDGTRLWAIDKPNIAQPPPGWKRQLHIRAEGGCRFADVYYVAPTGKRLRSMVEVQKFLDDHPDYVSSGITLSRFSFQTPKPLNEDYVRKRPAQKPASQDESNTDLQLETPALPPISSEASNADSIGQPVKKRAKMDS